MGKKKDEGRWQYASGIMEYNKKWEEDLTMEKGR